MYGALDVYLFPNKRLNFDLKNIEIWVSHGLKNITLHFINLQNKKKKKKLILKKIIFAKLLFFINKLHEKMILNHMHSELYDPENEGVKT